MRLVGALRWLREHPDEQRSLDQRLARLPAALLSPERPIEVVEGGRALRVRLYEVEREGPYWTIPLGG